MPATVRLLLVGIAALYLISIAAQFIGPYPALISSNTFGVVVVLFLALALGLHAALVVSIRTWNAAILAILSLGLMAALVLSGLMKVTGDSL